MHPRRPQMNANEQKPASVGREKKMIPKSPEAMAKPPRRLGQAAGITYVAAGTTLLAFATTLSLSPP